MKGRGTPRSTAGGSAIMRLEGDRPPRALDALREASAVELSQRFTKVALLHVEVAQQFLHRAAGGHLGEALVHLPSLSRLDVQSGGIRSWRHGRPFWAVPSGRARTGAG